MSPEVAMTTRKFIEPRHFADPEAAASSGWAYPYRVDQPAVPARIARHAGGIQRGPQARDRTRLAVAPRERYLCEVHTDSGAALFA
jgi:hypothetical protein